MSLTPDGWMKLAQEQAVEIDLLKSRNKSLQDDLLAVDASRKLLESTASGFHRRNINLMEQGEMQTQDRIRLLRLIREFVAADNEMEKYMADCNPEDRLTRAPVFDRFDAAVAALKEAVR